MGTSLVKSILVNLFENEIVLPNNDNGTIYSDFFLTLLKISQLIQKLLKHKNILFSIYSDSNNDCRDHDNDDDDDDINKIIIIVIIINRWWQNI